MEFIDFIAGEGEKSEAFDTAFPITGPPEKTILHCVLLHTSSTVYLVRGIREGA
jgi:hypothetical protein